MLNDARVASSGFFVKTKLTFKKHKKMQLYASFRFRAKPIVPRPDYYSGLKIARFDGQADQYLPLELQRRD